MQTYQIIGADQKQYGPITADQIRQWIKENRLNAQSQARLVGAQEWQPLSAFPEFADALNIGAAPAVLQAPAMPQADEAAARGAALNAVKGPAVSLIVTAVLNILVGLWAMVKELFVPSRFDDLSKFHQFGNPQIQKFFEQLYSPPILIGSTVFEILVALLILIGALKMQALHSYALAVTAGVLAVIPCVTPCCGIITLPFGIWALVVLNRPGVKSHFR